MMGIFNDYSGKCLHNDEPIHKFDLREYMNCFSYVPNKRLDLNIIERFNLKQSTDLQDGANYSTGELQRMLIKTAENKKAIYFS